MHFRLTNPGISADGVWPVPLARQSTGHARSTSCPFWASKYLDNISRYPSLKYLYQVPTRLGEKGPHIWKGGRGLTTHTI